MDPEPPPTAAAAEAGTGASSNNSSSSSSSSSSSGPAKPLIRLAAASRKRAAPGDDDGAGAGDDDNGSHNAGAETKKLKVVTVAPLPSEAPKLKLAAPATAAEPPVVSVPLKIKVPTPTAGSSGQQPPQQPQPPGAGTGDGTSMDVDTAAAAPSTTAPPPPGGPSTPAAHGQAQAPAQQPQPPPSSTSSGGGNKKRGATPTPTPTRGGSAAAAGAVEKDSVAVQRGPPLGTAATRAEIKRGLRQGNPQVFLREFQARNGLAAVPAAGPALQMLDMLGAGRVQVYRNIFVDLRAKLEERIDRCANEQQLERLLAASFPYLIIPELRSVPERIIARLRRVPPRFLDRLVAKPHILEELPMRVKQQAWEAHPALFRKALAALVEQYVGNRTVVVNPAVDWVLAGGLGAAVRGTSTQKRRGESPSLAQLVACVNKDEPKLEELACRFLCDEYIHKGDPALCTLFADLHLLLAHARAGRATVITRLTHLARALDEWVREGTVEPKGLCQVQIHLRHIIMTCDGTHPSSSAAPASGPANGNGNGNGSGSRKAAGSGAAKAPAPPPRKGQGAKGAGAGVSKVPTVERAVAEGMAFLGKLDAHRWFAKPVVEVWPDFKDAYLKLIPEPMDLGTMRQKSKTPGAYPTFAAFDRDATLVFDNCMAFNAPGTPFHSGADKMKRQWGKFKEKFGGVDLKVAADRTKALGGASTSATTSTTAGSIGGRGRSGGGSAVPIDEMKDPHTPQPLNARACIEGAMFGHALLLLADPFVVLTLLRTLARRVQEDCFKARALPKDHPMVPSLLQLLHLGLSARRQLTRVLRYKPPAPTAPPPTPTPPPPAPATTGGHRRGKSTASLVPAAPAVEPPPGYTVPAVSVGVLTGPPGGKDGGQPTAGGDAEESLRSVLPGLLELNAYVALVRRYDAAAPGGWEGQPHDRETVNERMLEAVGRLYRCCRAWQPAPLPLRLLQQALATSAASPHDDAKTTALVKTLAALYDHNHRKKRGEALAAAPDLQDRFLWHSLATACVRRTAGAPKPKASTTTTGAAATAPQQQPPKPLDVELRGLLLGFFTKQLPLAPQPRALSACHAQLARLLAEWAGPRGNGVLRAAGGGGGDDGGEGDAEEAEVVHAPLLAVVKEAVAAVGGQQAFKDLWEDARFAPVRRAYERLMERVPSVLAVVLGVEAEAEAEGGKGEAMDVGA